MIGSTHPATTALLCLSLLVATTAEAAAPRGRRTVPPPRPAEPKVELPPAVPAPTSELLAPVTVPSCLSRLRALGARADAAVAPAAPDPRCTIEEPVRLTGIALPFEAGRTVGLSGQPVVACRLAVAMTEWTGRVGVPIVQAGFGADVKAIRTGPGFACRPRNRVAGAKLSAHGQGLALDIAGFDLADGRHVPITAAPQPPAGMAALAAIRAAGCGWFLTVLGPGSDPSHADHLHLDLQVHGRSTSYRMCQ